MSQESSLKEQELTVRNKPPSSEDILLLTVIEVVSILDGHLENQFLANQFPESTFSCTNIARVRQYKHITDRIERAISLLDSGSSLPGLDLANGQVIQWLNARRESEELRKASNSIPWKKLCRYLKLVRDLLQRVADRVRDLESRATALELFVAIFKTAASNLDGNKVSWNWDQFGEGFAKRQANSEGKEQAIPSADLVVKSSQQFPAIVSLLTQTPNPEAQAAPGWQDHVYGTLTSLSALMTHTTPFPTIVSLLAKCSRTDIQPNSGHQETQTSSSALRAHTTSLPPVETLLTQSSNLEAQLEPGQREHVQEAQTTHTAPVSVTDIDSTYFGFHLASEALKHFSSIHILNPVSHGSFIGGKCHPYKLQSQTLVRKHVSNSNAFQTGHPTLTPQQQLEISKLKFRLRSFGGTPFSETSGSQSSITVQPRKLSHPYQQMQPNLFLQGSVGESLCQDPLTQDLMDLNETLFQQDSVGESLYQDPLTQDLADLNEILAEENLLLSPEFPENPKENEANYCLDNFYRCLNAQQDLLEGFVDDREPFKAVGFSLQDAIAGALPPQYLNEKLVDLNNMSDFSPESVSANSDYSDLNTPENIGTPNHENTDDQNRTDNREF